MVTKTLTITEDTYNLLVRRKRPDESFSEEINRLVGTRKPLAAFAGTLKMSEEDYKKMNELIENNRKYTSADVLKKLYP